MAELKIRQTQSVGDHSMETTFEAKDIDRLDEDLIKGLFAGREVGQAEQPEIRPRQAWVITEQPGVKHDVVAIYDNAGIPSIMHRFTKTTNKELFGGSEKTHPAFIIGGVEYDEIYISVYPNCEISGKPYSLPYQKPWTNITNDDAAKACFSKGEGWHMLTAVEWGLLADTSLMLGTLPHGNTSNGKYRYLTERECWRLQGYTDADFEAAAAVQKRNGRYTMALYKQAGNSIPVTIFESMFRKMIPGQTAESGV